MKTILSLLCCIALALTSFGQKPKHDINGRWRYYDSVKDTVNKGEGGAFVIFKDSSYIMLAAIGGAILPLGKEEKCFFKNDTLTFYPKVGKISVKVFFHNADLISYLDPDAKKRVYLKREKDE
jgi:hypothetical protein